MRIGLFPNSPQYDNYILCVSVETFLLRNFDALKTSIFWNQLHKTFVFQKTTFWISVNDVPNTRSSEIELTEVANSILFQTFNNIRERTLIYTVHIQIVACYSSHLVQTKIHFYSDILKLRYSWKWEHNAQIRKLTSRLLLTTLWGNGFLFLNFYIQE